MLTRRSLLVGFGAALAAPAIVRAGSLMPVRGVPLVQPISLFCSHGHEIGDVLVIDDQLFRVVSVRPDPKRGTWMIVGNGKIDLAPFQPSMVGVVPASDLTF